MPSGIVAEDFRVFAEQVADGIFISNPQGVYLEANPSAHRMLGYPPGELIGKTIFDLVPPSDYGRLADVIAHVAAGGVLTVEWTVRRKDGSPLDVEVTAQLLADGRLFAIVRDLSPRQALERKIRASEARLRSILETAPDTIMAVDRAGTILFINRVLAPLTVEQVVGSCCLDYVPEESRPRVEAALETVFARQVIDEYEVLGPPNEAGVREWNSVRAGPLIEGDRVVAAILCAANVTRRKESEALKARLEDQLRQAQKVESVGRLAGGVAHDFNNLLTSILGFVELAQARLPRGSEAAVFLDGAMESARRGAALTQQLLAFARKKIVRPEIVDLNGVLQEMNPMIRRLVGENLELQLTLERGLGPVLIDRGSVEQVIMNLVLNARDAIAGGGRVTVETRNVHLDAAYCSAHAETKPGDYVTLSVQDTGVGMTPEVANRAFEPFFTTKPVGEGSGLGLPMCEGIVRQAGGHITFSTEAGHGSAFLVHLPRAAEPRAPARATAPEAAAVGGRETLLLVEDEPMILAVAERSLSALGYQVIAAPDGPRALEIAARTAGPIHLLITDIVMPRMSGRELAARLSALRPGLRVLYSSGYTPDTIVQHGVLEEGIEFLQKPYTPTTLAARIRQLLDR